MILLLTLLILDLLLIWSIIVSKRSHWPFILGALVAVCVVNFLVIGAFSSGTGWPVKSYPAPGIFLGCSVQPGQAVYLLVQPTKQQHPRVGYVSPVNSPRLYQEPYSQALEKACDAAMKAGQQGVPMVVGKTKQKGQNTGNDYTAHFHFYPLPPGQLGKKP